jgi:dihydrolipoamide dehydrogenase
MATEVVMPQMGESIAEGTITKWLVKAGDKVERDQPLFEISTDKVDAEIPSPASGVLLEIRAEEGSTVPVGEVVALVGEEGEAPGEARAERAEPGPRAADEVAARADEKPEKGREPAKAEESAKHAKPEKGEKGPPPSGEDDEKYDYDLIVLGSGPGGYVAAIRAGQLGLKTVVVEKDPRFGGTCLLRGCIPTKALLWTAELLDHLRHGADFGITAEAALDVEKAYQHKSRVVDQNAKGVEFLFKKNKVEGIVEGRGRLVGAHQVEVDKNGEKRVLSARHILLATGSVPREVPFAKTDGERIVNSDHVLETAKVPKSVVVLGAGAVGTEFASIFRSFGSQEVTIVEMLPRLLPLEDEEISKELEKVFRKRGIKALTGAKMGEVEVAEGSVRMKVEQNGKNRSLEAEMLLVAVGRAPVTEGLGYEEQGIELDKGYIAVDESMRTAVPHIYAIGDIVKGVPWLAHVASAMGIVAVEHMAEHETRPLRYDRVPQVTFCDPEVASVGLTEAEAKEQGYDVQVGKFPFSALGKARIVGKPEGFVKVVREKKYDEVLGIHIIGAHATDLISEACAALQLETTAEELFRTIHPHPTLGEAVAEAAHASHGAAIHV